MLRSWCDRGHGWQSRCCGGPVQVGGLPAVSCTTPFRVTFCALVLLIAVAGTVLSIALRSTAPSCVGSVAPFPLRGTDSLADDVAVRGSRSRMKVGQWHFSSR
ncbi:hypothetical protein FM125_10670 [Micrococcus lylae]|uniref:Uncharacterized protein n=1 Tax=Micrococcus lylae TaxID=1273 RepID=A0A1R4JT85_9MICC|nr:hypothetical protein FM125_10670 [Micrococcus lylae]